MPAYLAIAPGSWGVEPPGDPTSPPWEQVLDEIQEAGYRFIELGPVGYLPEDPDALRQALSAREIKLAGGYAMEAFHLEQARETTLEVVERTCRVLAGGCAEKLVLIEALVPERARTVGRDQDAQRLDGGKLKTLVASLEAAAEIAASFGIAATFHPHAGTFVEFRDEIDTLMAELDPAAIGLCVDTGQSVIADIDPVELIEAYASRVDLLHLKDVDVEKLTEMREQKASFEQGVESGVFCPIGAGVVDFAAVAAILETIGFDGYATVEQDRLVGDPNALPDARASLSFAEQAGFEVSPGDTSKPAGAVQ
jgi:inosose dehydratase